jgi:RNA polymerase sigma-70 factor (ECF subfamily)
LGRPGPAGFDQVFRSRYGELYGLAWRLLGDRAEAEDVCQECFLKLAGDPVMGRPAEEVAAWLRRVCINACYNRLRGLRRAGQRLALVARLEPGGDTDDDAGPLDTVLTDELRRSVRRALTALPERQRACLLLRHSGYSYAEIAATLELAPGSVGTLLARAERTFRDNYQEHEHALS